MKHLMSRLAPLLVCAAGLAACGGGGGGASGGNTTPIAAAVKLSNVQPQRIDVKTVESTNPQLEVKLTGDVVGDLTSLNGQTLYVLLEDPSGLLSVRDTQFQQTGLGNVITLRTKPTTGRAGVLEGSLKVNVCLDAACTRPIGNSPASIPYKLSISAAPKFVDASAITVEVPFGTLDEAGANAAYPWATPAARRAVNVKMPDDLASAPLWVQLGTEWANDAGVATSQTFAGLGYSSGTSATAGAMFPMVLTLVPKPVGTYRGQVNVRSLWNASSTPPEYGESALLNVTYVVKDSGKPVMFVPAALNTIDDGITTAGPVFFHVVAADGTLYTKISRIEFGPEAGGLRWLFPFNSGVAEGGDKTGFTVVHSCDTAGCVARGRVYTAQIYVATESGKEAATPLTVTYDRKAFAN